MSNEYKGRAGHSAEFFGDTRDHWWNEDFLHAAARRWSAPRTVLDLGCGVGHWGRLLARVLPDTIRLTGVDRDPSWVTAATIRAAAAGLGGRFRYLAGTAESLPFEDGAFDLVTCQTVLMHVPRPDHVLAEMVRVARPGGWVAVAEPTNVIGPGLLEAIAIGASPDETTDLFRFHLICHRGKAALGEGDGFIGERLPSLFAAAGLQDVNLRLNDRVNPMLPPYESPAARATVEEMCDLAERGLMPFDESQTRRLFLAGGGRETEFTILWSRALAMQRRIAAMIRAGQFTWSGGGLFYLASGRKAGEGPPGV